MKSVSKRIIKIPIIGRYNRCSLKLAILIGSGRMKEGNKKAKNQISPNKIKFHRFVLVKKSKRANKIIEIMPYKNVVSCIIGKTERLNGKNIFPTNWTVAGILKYMDLIVLPKVTGME